MNIVKKIWAAITNGRLVWLRDYDGEITLSIAYKNPWGEWVAKRWWPYAIRNVILKEDGATDGGAYVESWKDVFV